MNNGTLSINSEILRQLSYVGDDNDALTRVLNYVKKIVKSVEKKHIDEMEKESTWKNMGLDDNAAKSAAQSTKEYNRGEYAFKGTVAEAIEFLNSL